VPGLPGCTLGRIEVALIALLIAAYIGINLGPDLPRFLIAENLTLAAAYTAVLYLILAGSQWGQPLTILLSAFNAGRVSRSIIGPRGEIGELALQHIPLLALILAVSIIALILTVRRGC